MHEKPDERAPNRTHEAHKAHTDDENEQHAKTAQTAQKHGKLLEQRVADLEKTCEQLVGALLHISPDSADYLKKLEHPANTHTLNDEHALNDEHTATEEMESKK